MLRRFWRWLTLADISAGDFSVKSVPREATCHFCDSRANCTVWINDESWRTCMEHIRVPRETTFPQENTEGRPMTDGRPYYPSQ